VKISGRGADADTKICALCGRVGVRRFKVQTTALVQLDYQRSMIVCTDEKACRKRWKDAEGEE
jgi:hypothetical protein